MLHHVYKPIILTQLSIISYLVDGEKIHYVADVAILNKAILGARLLLQ